MCLTSNVTLTSSAADRQPEVTSRRVDDQPTLLSTTNRPQLLTSHIDDPTDNYQTGDVEPNNDDDAKRQRRLSADQLHEASSKRKLLTTSTLRSQLHLIFSLSAARLRRTLKVAQCLDSDCAANPQSCTIIKYNCFGTNGVITY